MKIIEAVSEHAKLHDAKLKKKKIICQKLNNSLEGRNLGGGGSIIDGVHIDTFFYLFNMYNTFVITVKV